MPRSKTSSRSDFLQDNVENDHLSSYSAWRGLLHSYSTLRKESIVVKDTKRLRYLRNQIVWNYLKNFFYFPILLFRLLTPSFMKGRVNIWTNLKTITTTREFRPLRMAVLMQCVFLYAIGHLGYIVFHNYAIPTYAATYTWVQNNWSGGASTTATAIHPANQTSFARYHSASSTITAGATVSLSPESVSKVFTNTDDFTGGTLSDTAITGSGDAAKLALYGEVEEVNSWDTVLSSLPAVVGANSQMIRNGSDDHVYVLRGTNTDSFYRYSISGNSWTTLTNVPGTVNTGSQMIRNGSDDHIYVLPGNNTANFYRYSISGNSWTTLTAVPGSVNYGSEMFRSHNEDFIYILQGNNTANFYRYSISGNSWTTLASTGFAASAHATIIRHDNDDYMYLSTYVSEYVGSCLRRYSISGNSWTELASDGGWGGCSGVIIRNGSDDYIYSWSSGTFRRYSISGNSWTTLASSFLTGGGYGCVIDGGMVRNGSDDYIYVLHAHGNNTQRFPTLTRYSISSNSWTKLATTPSMPGCGLQMIGNGNDDRIYVLRGGNSTQFYRYSISSNSWADHTTSNLSSLPGSVGVGGQIIRNGSDDHIYTLLGNSTAFYRYSISGNLWTVLASSPGVIASYASMIRNGSDDHIYVLRGNSTANFYRYSISGNSWTTLTAAPGAIGWGSQMIRNGSDDHIYVLRGGSWSNFYRYSISGNSWTTLTVVPGNVGPGAQMIRNGSDDHIYVLPGLQSTSFYRYSISGNSWTTLTAAPGAISGGSQMIRNGSDDHIYVLRGDNANGFYRYSISGNSWTTLTSVPGVASSGSRMIRNGSDDHIYTLLGNSTAFYRYSISSNSWTTLPSIPGILNADSSFIRNSNDGEFYAVYGSGSNQLYRFTISRTTYSTPGTYTSPVFDTTGNTGFTTLSYTSSTPTNTTLTIDARAGNTLTPDETWTSWQTGISTGGDISAFGTRRYIQYRANLSTTNNARTPELADLTLQYGRYTSGSLVSTPYNANDASNVFGSISWSESETPGTSVTFQVRTSPNNATWTDWTGPDGTSATVFTDSTGAQDMPAIFNDSQDDQWMQYRMTLTGSGASTPTVSDVTVTYVVNAPPDIAIVTSTPMVQSSAGVVALSYLVRDIDTSVGVTPGTVDIDLQYCTSNCASVGNEVWETAASSSLTGTYGEAISIQAEDYTEYSLIWDPTISLPGHYNGTDFKIRLRANDSEAANNYGYDESNTFTLDTADPVVSMSIDGRNDAPYNLTLAVTDDTTAGLEMKLSNNSDLSPDGLNPGSGTWVPYLTTSTWDFPLGGTTVYYQVRDAYSNVSASGAISQAQTPAVPDSIVYRDVSNSETEEWREFIAWGVVPLPGPGFDEYTLWRSTDGGVTYTELTTQADRLINYYIDDNLSTETTYYYRVSVTDSDGNISKYSRIASDRTGWTRRQ
jgi:hypothetical protein